MFWYKSWLDIQIDFEKMMFPEEKSSAFNKILNNTKSNEPGVSIITSYPFLTNLIGQFQIS